MVEISLNLQENEISVERNTEKLIRVIIQIGSISTLPFLATHMVDVYSLEVRCPLRLRVCLRDSSNSYFEKT